MRVLPCLIATACLAACVETAPPGLPDAPDAPDACGASAMQDLLGKDRSVLASMTLPSPTRVIEPGMAVTMDYNPARLNITLDEAGKITGVTCS